jgi:hypothetical protein
MTAKALFILSCCATALIVSQGDWLARADDKQTQEVKAPAPPLVRWVKISSIDVEIVGMKKEIALDAEAAAKLFVKDFPHIGEGWEKKVPGKIEDDKGAQTIPDDIKKVWIPAKDDKPYATVLEFSDKELIVVVMEHKGRYLWHLYYECKARLRVTRSKEVDALFDVASLEKTYGAEHKGLKQGDSAKDVIKTLGEPDARIGYQAAGLENLCYFKDDVIITINTGRIERFDFGVPDSLKEEVKKNGPRITRY